VRLCGAAKSQVKYIVVLIDRWTDRLVDRFLDRWVVMLRRI
jgi:hypothetical protein